MKRLLVIISPTVYRQVDQIVCYIANDSIDRALAWEERLLAALNWLAEVHGHAIDEDASERLGQTIRKLVFERTYLIHYHVSEQSKVVVVLNVRHGARLPRAGEP